MAQWKSSGEPYCWHEMESAKGLVVLADSSYGQLALIDDKNGKVLSIGHYTIVTKECVVLDKDYYGTEHYMWFPNAD